MRNRIVGLTAALVMLFVGGTTASAKVAAADADRTAAHPQRVVRNQVLFTFDNRDSLRPGTRVTNSAGRGHGQVLVSDGGELRRVNGAIRRGAGFPAACADCGRAVIEVSDRPALDPRLRSFKFGAVVKMTRRQGAHNMNIVQKGYFRQAGGQYKLQVDLGRPSCVVFGSSGRVIARSARRISDWRWHTVTCQRRPRGLVLRVDGRVRARVTGRSGVVSNSTAVRIGGRKAYGLNDQYHGRIDNVFIRIRRG